MSECGYWKKILVGLVFTMLCRVPMRAQEEPKPASDEKDTLPQTPENQPTQPTSSQEQNSSVLGTRQMEVRPAGKASPLLAYDSFRRWGPIYVRSLEFLEGHDEIDAVGGTGQGICNQRSFTSSV